MNENKITKKKLIIDIISGIIVLVLIVVGYKLFLNNKEENHKKTAKTETTTVLDNDNKLMNPNINWTHLLSENKDIVGWIFIPDTNINYPILCSSEREKYLKIDWKTGEKTLGGSIFGDSRYYGEKIADTDKYIIHGHNLGPTSTKMFSQLKEYLNEDFYTEHPNIYIYTPDRNIKYDIISIRIVEPTDSLYQQIDRINHQDWINEQIKKSNIKCNTSKYTLNKSLILSTCTNDEENRIAIVGEAAKIVRPNK